MKQKCLQHRQTEGASADTDYVEIKSTDEDLVGLHHAVIRLKRWILRVNRILGWGKLQRDVGQLAKVGTGSWVHGLGLQGKAVDVVASLLWDRGKVVPWLDKREVVTAHLEETVGVLVQQAGERNWVSSVKTVDNLVIVGDDGADTTCGVVRPLAGLVVVGVADGCVSNVPEQGLDAVAEANVIAGIAVDTDLESIERATTMALNLLNDHITRTLTHLDALLVGDNRVVSPQLDITKRDAALSGQEVGGCDCAIKDEQLTPVTELKVDAHLIVWQSRCWECVTSITGEEIWKWHVNSVGGECKGWCSKIGDVTDHVVVSITLALGNGEGRPHIKPVAIKLLDLQVVKRDPGKIYKVMANVSGPTDTISGSRGT